MSLTSLETVGTPARHDDNNEREDDAAAAHR